MRWQERWESNNSGKWKKQVGGWHCSAVAYWGSLVVLERDKEATGKAQRKTMGFEFHPGKEVTYLHISYCTGRVSLDSKGKNLPGHTPARLHTPHLLAFTVRIQCLHHSVYVCFASRIRITNKSELNQKLKQQVVFLFLCPENTNSGTHSPRVEESGSSTQQLEMHFHWYYQRYFFFLFLLLFVYLFIKYILAILNLLATIKGFLFQWRPRVWGVDEPSWFKTQFNL